jgi:hypothetical protein
LFGNTLVCILSIAKKSSVNKKKLSKVTWEENWAKCCSLGMKPIVFETAEELHCFNNLSQNGDLESWLSIINIEYGTFQGAWKFNLNYWTAGTNRDNPGQWSWCGTHPLQGISDSLQWGLGQPDNLKGKEECLHLLVTNGTGITFSDRNCSLRFLYACEVRNYPTFI